MSSIIYLPINDHIHFQVSVYLVQNRFSFFFLFDILYVFPNHRPVLLVSLT